MEHDAVTLPKTVKENYPWSQLFAILIVCLPGLGNGLQFAWTSPAVPILISEGSPVPMTFEEASYLAIIPSVAVVICSPLLGKLLDTVGRKPVILFIAVPHIIAWVTISFAQSLWMLYFARAIAGIADAATFTAIPVYIGEVLEPKIRGSLGSLLSFTTYFGQFLMNVIGTYTSVQTCALICLIFPVIFVVTFIFMPETPYYLLMKNRTDAARQSLKKLRVNDDVEEELKKLTNDVHRQLSESNSIKHLFTIDSNRRAIFVAVGLRTVQQLSGISAFSVYAQYVFEKAGGDVSRSTSAMIFSGVQAFIVCFSPIIVDKFGRRPLMMFSCSGCAVLLIIETIYFYFSDYSSIDISVVNWIPITGMMLYIVMFCVGFGIIPTLMIGELFSASIKGKAVCFMSMYYAVCIFVTSKVFQLMAHHLGLFAPFCLFSVCCFAGIFFSYYCLPETKGKTLEEIQQCLKRKTVKGRSYTGSFDGEKGEKLRLFLKK